MFLSMTALIFAECGAKEDSLFCSVFGVCDTQDKDKKPKQVFCPRMDFSESKTQYKITIEVPGIAVKDIKVETENRVLYISGEKKQQIDEKDQKTHRQECRYGEFKRELLLPEDAIVENIQAKCEHNMLYITIPRKPSDRKAIPIQTA